MRAIIVDDEEANLENLRHLLGKYCAEVKIVAEAKNVDEALGKVTLHGPEILFLDIQLGKQTGFDLLSQIDNPSFEVIFVTAYDHYGIQAVKFAALDYLLKPVNPDELIEAVKKASLRIQSKTHTEQLSFLLQQIRSPEQAIPKIALPQSQEIRYVRITEITRCEADNTYTTFYFEDGKHVVVSKSLKEYSDLLKPHGFLRTHQSHLVNPSHVKSWLKEDGGILLMKNGDKIPVSKANRESIKQQLSQ